VLKNLNLPTSETAISLATSTGNLKMHSQGLENLAWIKWKLGNYADAQVHAYNAQTLARMSGLWRFRQRSKSIAY
jgi:hypothetical protein